MPAKAIAVAALSLATNHMASAFPVIDQDTGKYWKFGQLRRHPTYAEIWYRSFPNEMGRLCSGVGTVLDGKGKRVEGTNTFFVIHFEEIPEDRIKEVCYTSILCAERPGKSDPNRTCITIFSTNVCYPGYVGTKNASMALSKLMINSMLSR